MNPQNVNRFRQWWCRYDDKFISFLDVSRNQMHSVTLDPIERVKLTWMVDWPEKNVFFQVKNGINERYSWFAVGFSRRGEFPRTDFCIFQRENEKIDINIVSHKSSSSAAEPHSLVTNWINIWALQWCHREHKHRELIVKLWREFALLLWHVLFNAREIVCHVFMSKLFYATSEIKLSVTSLNNNPTSNIFHQTLPSFSLCSRMLGRRTMVVK